MATTHIINREFFYSSVRNSLFHGKLKQAQVNGMNAILDEWEKNYSNGDDRFLAYMLATTFHETATTMQPIEEYGRGKGRTYGKPDPISGKVYFGRGFVQLTWKANYEKFAKLLKVDLVSSPELALNLDVSTKILFVGMVKGLFTGKKLADYFDGAKEDWVNARRIINGTDKAQLIAGYGRGFYAAISYRPA
jgi:putative chitinase